MQKYSAHSRTSMSLAALAIASLSHFNINPVSAAPGDSHTEAQAISQKREGKNPAKSNAISRDKNKSIRKLDFISHDLDYQIIDLYTVTTVEDEILIEISSDILFDFDKSSLKPSAFASLQSAAKRIIDTARGNVRIEGHTDSKGSHAYNQSLSEARAQSVYTWLVENGDLSDINFVVSGHGETKPIEPNQTDRGEDNPAGRQRNRRVEIIVNTSQ